MKTVFLLLACTCLLGGLSALNFPLEDKNFRKNVETFEDAFRDDSDDGLESLLPKNENDENWSLTSTAVSILRPRPTTPTRPTPPSSTTTLRPTTTTAPSSTTTLRPTTTTAPSSTTTFRPTKPTRPTTSTRPTTPTRSTTPTRPTRSTPPSSTTNPKPTNKPRPLPPPVRSENVQVYENTVRGLGPFASQLINIVLNKEGNQKTVQENDIFYKFNEDEGTEE